jgi:tRNA U55 pseudouridine synthase TruB
MKTRRAEIISSEILSFSYPELIIDITVSAGTYIRSIAFDLGEILGS